MEYNEYKDTPALALLSENELNNIENIFKDKNTHIKRQIVRPSNILILSNKLHSLGSTTVSLRVKDEIRLQEGTIGTYRRVYLRGKHDFGFLEETRMVTRILSYKELPLLHMCPVISLEGSMAQVALTNIIFLYLDDDVWVKVDYGRTFLEQRGCEFSLSLGDTPLKRTLALDGYYLERNGLVGRSTIGNIVPHRFEKLFLEAMSDSIAF